MGRAIVREPKAFLMDEPLSNLDAKLRVQMRSEIARIQHELNVTTLYVTHDQVEAMTMGDRVAVIKKGVLQQVDDAPVPVRPPDEPVRRRVHRLALDEPGRGHALRARTGRSTSEFGGDTIVVPDDVLGDASGPQGLRGEGGHLGIRPEDMEDASLVPEAPAEHRIRSEVILREALGADVLAHFMIKAPTVITEDVKELAHDVGAEALEAVERGAEAGESEFMARLNPRTRAAKGEQIELVIDVHRMHYFDQETGEGIYGGKDSPQPSGEISA